MTSSSLDRSVFSHLRDWTLWIAAFVFAVEASARIDDRLNWGAPLVGTYSNETLVTRDSVIIRGRPGAQYEKWKMNSLGFRGPETTLAPASGVTRIAVLGASETFGLHESAGHEYPARLQQMLDSLAPGKYEIVNVGLPGMSPSAMLPYVEHAVRPLAPAMVIVYPSPSFFLETVPPPERFVLPRLRTTPEPVVGVPTFRSVAKAKNVIKRVVPSGLQVAVREWGLARTRAAQPADWVWQQVPSDRVALFERQMRDVVVAIKGIGATPLLVTHTNRMLTRGAPGTALDHQQLLGVTALYYPRASESVIVGIDSAANDVLRRLATEHEAPVAEGMGGVPSDSLHFADYAHFTDRGAEAMARTLAQRILTLGPR